MKKKKLNSNSEYNTRNNPRCQVPWNEFDHEFNKRFDDSVHAQELITDDVKNVVRLPTVSLMLLPHFDAFCDLLLKRQRATGNLSFS